MALATADAIHENVLSQCDNLVLMRMNSVADLGHVAHTQP